MGQSILTPDQQRLLDIITSSSIITDTFYLTGGTALAEYYFQHRISEDFDFFTEAAFDEFQVISWVKQTAKKLKIKEVEYKTLHGQLIFFFHFATSVVKIDFAYYPFSHLGEFKKISGLKIASVIDIAVNKLQAIQTRNRGRDFFDLFVILHHSKLTLEQLIKEYRNKFDVTISAQEVAKNLLKVIDAMDQPRFLGTLKWTEVETFLLEKAKELGAEVIG